MNSFSSQGKQGRICLPFFLCLKMDLINLISEDNNLIVYRPSLRAIGKSVTGTILLSQIIYRWDKNKRKPFYKFKAPCGHEDYRHGDSWQEELGFSVKEVDSALKNIAFKITAKTNNEEHELPVEYWTKQDRKTFYKINEGNLQKLLNGIFLNDKVGFRKTTNQDLHYISENNTKTNTNNTKVQNEFEQVKYVWEDDLNKTTSNALNENSKKQKEKSCAKKEKIKEDFEAWWNAYDKKVGRHPSFLKWNKLKDEERQKCLDYVSTFVKANPEKQYRPNPATYLNQKRFLDEILTENKVNNAKPIKKAKSLFDVIKFDTNR